MRPIKNSKARSQPFAKGPKAVAAAIKAQSQQIKALQLLKSGVEALAAKDYPSATLQIKQAIALDKTNAAAWRMLAISYENQNELVKALMAYEAASRLSPGDVDLLRNIGNLAQRIGQPKIARALFERFLETTPGHVEVTNLLACILRDQHLYGDATELLRDLINKDPAQPLLWNSLGSILEFSGDVAGAIVFYDEAIRLDPRYHKARQNRAYCLMLLNENEQAIAELEIAIKDTTDPKQVAAIRLVKALNEFIMGDLVNGMISYEARLDGVTPNIRFEAFGERWQVEDDLKGKTLLVYAEQGLGDEVLFASTLNETLEALGPDGRMILACEPRLVSLFQRSFPRAEVRPYISRRDIDTHFKTVDLGEPVPPIDLWVPLVSLFQRFRRSLEDFPKTNTFLVPDPDRVAYWRDQLKASGEGPYVGLLWKSINLAGGRLRHYSPFELWGPILEKPNVRFVNLQYGEVDEELAAAKAQGFDIWTPPGIDLKMDIEDLAALCAAMDVVIGPSTATTNIAAAVGTRVWISAGPGWWTSFGTDYAPCYPTVRVFRTERFNNWEVVTQAMAEAIDEELLAGRTLEPVAP